MCLNINSSSTLIKELHKKVVWKKRNTQNNRFLPSVWAFLKGEWIFRVQMFYIIFSKVLDLDDHTIKCLKTTPLHA